MLYVIFTILIMMEKKRFSLVTSDLTSRILAYKELKDFNIDQAVDWAIEMLYLGYETPSILILAGISKPCFRI